MCRTCGLLPSAIAARSPTPNRCCSSTTATARSLNVDVSLDERVGSDGDLDVAGRDQLADVRVLALGEAAREERHPDTECREDALDREKVLLGERLGRGHERALAPGLDRPQQRIYRDCRLSGADVTLQQPLHRRGAGQVGVDLHDGVLLRTGEREWQRGSVPIDEISRRQQRLGHERLTFRSTAAQRELEREQLVEREPLTPELRLDERARTMQGHKRVGS